MKLSYGKTFVLGFGFLGVSAIWAIYNAFVPLFLAQKFGLGPAFIAFFLSLDNTAALFIQPPVGVWSDKLRTPIGRRMPFIAFAAPAAALAFAMMPLAAILPLFVVCTVTLMTAMAVWRTPVMALVADVTPSPLRSQASGVISFMGGVGGIIAYFGGASLAEVNPAYPFWLGAAVVTIAAVLLVVFVKEPKTYASDEVGLDESQPGFFASLREIVLNPDKSTLFLVLALFFLMVGYSAIESFFSLYAFHHLGMSGATGSRLLGQISLVFVLFAVPSGSLAARFSRRGIVMSGLILMSALVLVIFFVPPAILARSLFSLPLLGKVPVLGALLMLVGIAWALIIIHPLPMLSDMTSDKSLGTYTGLYYLFTSLAAIAGPNLNGWVVQLSGGNYNLVMLFSPISLMIAWALMWGVKKGEPGLGAVEAVPPTEFKAA